MAGRARVETWWTAIGAYRHTVHLSEPGPTVPDGDGGFTQGWADVQPPLWYVSIQPASAHDLERVAAGTVLTTASHIVRGRYLAGVTTSSRMLFKGRTFAVTGIRNIDERSIDMELVAVEMLGPQ